MHRGEFRLIAELAALQTPEGADETRDFVESRQMLRSFAARVAGTPGGSGAARSGQSPKQAAEDSPRSPGPPLSDPPAPRRLPSARLRADEVRIGLREGAVFALAPEHRERLILVPPILGKEGEDA